MYEILAQFHTMLNYEQKSIYILLTLVGARMHTLSFSYILPGELRAAGGRFSIGSVPTDVEN